MRRARVVSMALLLLGPGVGCDVDRWMELRGIPTFREVAVEEGARILSEEDALLLQVLSPGRPSHPLREAMLVTEGEPLPDLVRDGTGPVVVVVATEREQALGYAAQLARAGVSRVVVVDGGPAAWKEARAPSADEKPAGG